MHPEIIISIILEGKYTTFATVESFKQLLHAYKRSLIFVKLDSNFMSIMLNEINILGYTLSILSTKFLWYGLKCCKNIEISNLILNTSLVKMNLMKIFTIVSIVHFSSSRTLTNLAGRSSVSVISELSKHISM